MMNFATTNTEKAPALIAEDLCVGYMQGRETTRVAQDIRFKISKGQLVAIVGVNGIGKSTLLRTLAKIQPAISGRILMNGKSLDVFREGELAQVVSVVLTEPVPTRNLRVAELVSLGRQPYTNWIGRMAPEDLRKVTGSIETVGLSRLWSEKCHELSDGQLQKVMIARALAQDTDIMLLDEPTTHLDLYHKVQILKLLQRIAHESNKCILFTTHEIDMAIQLCDRILLLDNRENPFGDPCQLIEDKRFENLFPPGMVHFDPETGTFRIHK